MSTLIPNGHNAISTHVPNLLTPIEVAALLRTSRKAIYSMVERGQLPGIVRIGRRVLVREDAMIHFVGQRSTPSLEGRQR